VIAGFTLVYLSFGGRDEEALSGFGSRIATLRRNGVISESGQIFPALRILSMFP
jgi:hypothetical protein